MHATNWSKLWQQAGAYAHERVVFALMVFNGVSIQQIHQLGNATITSGWITFPDGHTFPLTTYAREALAALNRQPIDEVALGRAIAQYEDFEDAAHRQLAGALWLTNDENHILLETPGVPAEPLLPLLPLRFMFPISITLRLQPDDTSAIAMQSREVLQTAADWIYHEVVSPPKSLMNRVIGLLRQGSFVFLIASTGVSGLNLIHNVLMGRLLSPADYSQLTFLITLQLLIGLLPTMLQTVAARFGARYHARNEPANMAALLQRTRRFGWIGGGAIMVILLVLSPLFVNLFQLDSVWLLAPVLLAIPAFVVMGADRGFLQGVGRYFWLSGAFVTEGVIRLGMGVVLGYALLSTGRALDGAMWGVVQSMIATWFVSWLAIRHFRRAAPTTDIRADERREWIQLGGASLLALVGQALITNSDFILVKNFFTPEEAGLYAAVSVLGRIVYFGALPLTILLVPVIARKQALGEPTRPIFLLLIGGGVAVCGALIAGAWLFAPLVLGLLYGEAYVSAAGLLAPYALAASLYTLTNLAVTYQIALGKRGETWMPIVAGTAQIVLVILLHNSLTQVITIQIVLMAVLLALVLWRSLTPERPAPISGLLTDTSTA